MNDIQLTHPGAEQYTLAALNGAGGEDLRRLHVDAIDPKWYSTPVGQVIAEAAIRTYTGDSPLGDVATHRMCARIIKERKLQTVSVPLSMIEELGKAKHIVDERMIEPLRTFYTLREIRKIGQGIEEELQISVDAEEIAERAAAALDIISSKSSTTSRWREGNETLGHASTVIERSRRIASGEVKPFKWPNQWATWEKHVEYLERGFVGVVIGGTKTGKSSVLEQVGEAWAMDGHNVVLVHCENDATYTLNRRLCRWSGVPMRDMMRGTLTKAQEDLLIESERGVVNATGGRLHYLNGAGWSIEEICREVENQVNNGNCDAVIWDYIQKTDPSPLTGRTYQGNFYQMQAAMFEHFKSTCVGLNIVGLTASQMKTGGSLEDGVSQVFGSKQVAHKAQLVISMERPILETNMADENGHPLANKGSYSPLIDVTVLAQNIGGGARFKQVMEGPRFSIRDGNFHNGGS